MDDGKEINVEKNFWKRKFEFLIWSIGFNNGFLNIFRIPYMQYRNGGSTFLIPYLLTMFIVVLPSYYLGLVFGQISKTGILTAWKSKVDGRGIGYALFFLTFLFAAEYIYLTCQIMIYMYYVVISFFRVVPWSNCNNPFNTKQCTTERNYGIEVGGPNQVNYTYIGPPPNPSTEFYRYYILDGQKNDHYDVQFGKSIINFIYIIPLAVCFILSLLCTIRGIKSLSKIFYILTFLPIIILIILIIKHATLSSFVDGLRYGFYPSFDVMLHMPFWKHGVQAAFLTIGGAITIPVFMGSRLKDNTNCFTVAIITVLMNVTVTLACCVLVYSMTSYLSEKLQIGFSEVMTSGTDTIFFIFLEGYSSMNLSSLWLFLVYLMLFLSFFAYIISGVESITSCLADTNSKLWWKSLTRNIIFRIFILIIIFLAAVPFITKYGLILFESVDFTAYISYIICSTIFFIHLMYFYNFKLFRSKYEDFFDKKLNSCISFFWLITIPLFSICISVIVCIQFDFYHLSWDNPRWIGIFNWCILLFPVLLILIFFGLKLTSFMKILKCCTNWASDAYED